MITLAAINAAITAYCEAHRIDPIRCCGSGIFEVGWRRHPQLTRLGLCRNLLLAGRLDEIPEGILASPELKPTPRGRKHR